MATVTRGFTYGVNGTVTNTNLHSLVDAATVTQIVSADFTLTTTNPIHLGSSAPSSSDQRFWYDTTNDVYKVKDSGGVFQPINGHVYVNKSGDSLTAGDVVIIDTANDLSVTTTTTANNTAVFGVIIIGGANDAAVFVATEGYVPTLKVTGSTNNGDYLFTSTTVKKADPSATFGSGAFARAMDTSSSSVEAQLGGATMIANVTGSRFSAVEQVSLSRAKTTASGDSVISHNLGTIPLTIDCVSTDGTSSGALSSTGFCSIQGSTFAQAARGSTDSGAGGQYLEAGAITILSDAATTNKQVGVVSAATTTNFTVTFTKTGTPIGNANYLYEFVLAG